MVELKNMSLVELEAHKAEVDKLIKQHHDARKGELVRAIVTAANQLMSEYPHSSCDMEVVCPDCDICFDVDILEHLTKLSVRDFSIY